MAERLHFSGIGGTAMVAGARIALEAGCEVRGSDGVLYPPASHMVQALQIPVYSGYSADNLSWSPDTVIIGNALSRGNPEVEYVLSHRLTYTSLPEWLKRNVLHARHSIVISGTHGKTTTTALTAHVLKAHDPGTGYLIGGEALGFSHSSHLGKEGAPFVIEGDEYDTAFFDKRAKFLHYLPNTAVVTSLEFDHGDIYHDLGDIEIAFQRMFRQIPAEGLVLLCADNHALSLATHSFSCVETYGFHENALWRGNYTAEASNCQEMQVFYKQTLWGSVPLPLSGQHNHQNILAAIAVAASLGMKQQDIAAAIASFKGVRRRLETFLESQGILFVDDFAHHPTAIKGSIAAAKTKWPKRCLIAVVEPRSNTMVTNRFQDDLRDALKEADVVFLGPIHRSSSLPESDRLNREEIVQSLTAWGRDAVFFDEVPELVHALHNTARQNDVVLIMSNGAFGGIYTLLKEMYL
ncbi:MAG TPA: Mur ligase family protein [Candidatus Hydrogenedentes bacterium]|nr:Mur ligase family protein [Candidatus Hydrogenedentota bacterium]